MAEVDGADNSKPWRKSAPPLNAEELLIEGKRRFIMEEFAPAADFFSKSLEKAVEEYGQSDLRLVNHCCYYARALIALGNGEEEEGEESDLSDGEIINNPEAGQRAPESEENKTAKSDDDSDEVEPKNSDIAIECLIWARDILKQQKELDNDKMECLGTIHLQLADVASKSRQWEQVHSDASEALNILNQTKDVPLMLLAEGHYLKGLGAEWQKNVDEAKQSYGQVDEILKRHDKQLEKMRAEATNSDDEDDINTEVTKHEDMINKLAVRHYMMDEEFRKIFKDNVEDIVEKAADIPDLRTVGVKRKAKDDDSAPKRIC